MWSYYREKSEYLVKIHLSELMTTTKPLIMSMLRYKSTYRCPSEPDTCTYVMNVKY